MTGLPLPDSLWAATAAKPAPLPTLQGELESDVAIIGAGFTGLRAALCLAETGVSVTVVDAGQPGWGASGRNGGQVNPMGHETVEEIQSRLGVEQGTRLAAMISQSADELFTLVAKHGIDCDAEQHGWVRAAHSRGALNTMRLMFESWERNGTELAWLERDALSTVTGAPAYHGGWLAARGGSVHPLKYAQGLAQCASTAGAKLFSNTRITSLEYQNDGWLLASDNGQVRAERVILATNGYTDHLFPGLEQSIVPVISVQSATEPLSEDQLAQVLPQRQTLSDSRRVIFYCKKTFDNRLVFGTAGEADDPPGAKEMNRVKTGISTVFPMLANTRIDYLWGGRIAVTRDHLPHMHQPAPGLWTALGCNGRGVALCTVMGRLLAEAVTGKRNDNAPIPVSSIPRYPFHRFHQTGIAIAVRWKEFWDRREAAE